MLIFSLNNESTSFWTRGPMISIAGMATEYAIAHDLNHIFRNLSLKPILTEISVKEIMPVVMIPIIMAKAIFCFMVIIEIMNRLSG